MGNTVHCCVRRDDEGEAPGPRVQRCESWHSLPDVTEEQWSFFQRLEDVSEASSEDNTSKGEEEAGVESQPVGAPEAPPAEPAPAEGEAGEDQARPLLLPVNKRRERRNSGGVQCRAERAHSWVRLRANSRPLNLVPEELRAAARGRPLSFSAASPMTRAENKAFLHLVDGLREKVRQNWEKKLEKKEQLDQHLQRQLASGFPELEDWTNDDTCLRMLRAVVGDHETAANMLTKAIECRLRDRELYTSLCCEVHCDIRIIGRDVEQRPVVYMCARSQKSPLKDLGQQVILAFEAGVRLSEGDGMGNGKMLFIADMHGFSTGLNMDVGTLKELAGSMGTVFADRFCYILVVDFSFLAQSIWALCKPMLTERTQKKINFVGLKKAKEVCKERLSGPTHDRVISAFDINRAKGITAQEREDHALRTSICDVPLGASRPADHAG